MKTVILHVGAPKSASTLIQNMLADNQDQLKRSNTYYETFINKETPLGQLAYQKNISNNKLNKIREWTEKYNALNEQQIIISNERYFGNSYDNFSDIKPIVSRLRYVFKNFSVKIIAIVRRQDTFIESLYCQNIKGNLETRTFNEFIQQIDIYSANWLKLLSYYEDKFGFDNIGVIPYERLLLHNIAFIQKFFQMVGINITINNLPVVNPSLDIEAMELMRFANTFVNDMIKRYKLRKALENIFPKSVNKPISLFTQEQRIQLMSEYRKSNTELFQRYMKNDNINIWYN